MEANRSAFDNSISPPSWADMVVIIPAFNEEPNVGVVVRAVAQNVPGAEIVVINDGSKDNTAEVAKSSGATVIDLPCNVGVGGAVQAGFLYAISRRARLVVRVDADGQHPPEEVPALMRAAMENEEDLIVGSRFLSENGYLSSAGRLAGIRLLSLFMSLICRSKVTDPTSGCWAIKRPLLDVFARDYPSDYPEPEALALMRRRGYSFREIPIVFRPRQAGSSSISKWDALFHAAKIMLSLVVDRVRYIDHSLDRPKMLERMRREAASDGAVGYNISRKV